METVKNTGSHIVDLDDGRQLAPGDTAEDVPVNNAHNKSLVEDGFLTVLSTERAKSEPPEPPQVATPRRIKEGSDER